MPNWKKVITSGSDASLNSLNVTNGAGVTGSLQIYKSGSTVFNIEGSQGTLFTVTDELSGSLFSVNDISGIPIFEVFSDDTVKIGTHNQEGIVVTGSNVVITGSLTGRVLDITPATATASMDCSLSNFFSLTLSGSYDIYLNPTNILPGQAISVEITQPVTSGSISFAPSIYFAGGLDYEATATGSVVDILSLISFDDTSLYATALKNLS